VRLVIFVQGCHFRCLYCHNPDTWALKGGTLIEVDELIQKALLQKPFFGIRGGVTVSGGEPLVQRKALSEFFKKLHMQGVHTVLDTNGHTIDEDAQDLLRHTDLVLLDVKQIHNEKHKKLTGRPVDEVLQFARYCEDHNVHMWLRYVLVPGVNDDAQDLTQWAKYFHGWKQVERVEILGRTPQLASLEQLKLFVPLTQDGPHTQVSFRIAFDKKIMWPQKRSAMVLTDSEYNITLFAEEQV
jgi:pyruvate formate lyase activating enzyme